MKKTYIQPLATKYQLEIESLLLEASDQGDHAESNHRYSSRKRLQRTILTGQIMIK